MNRKDRRELAAGIRKYYAVTKRASDELRRTVEKLKTQEEEKQDNLPESLAESHQAENIEEAIDKLESLIECIETAETAYEDILDISGMEVSNLPIETADTILETEPRNRRFQILLSSGLMNRLKIRSMESGSSCNEIIYRALQQYLA